jgi:DNA-binding HxlR family transcriptional regulator
VKLQNLLNDPAVQVLRYLGQKGEVRYIEIQNSVKLSRSTINAVIHDLEDRKLISRRISLTKPVEVYYSITPKGKEATAHFDKLRGLIL